MPSARPTPAHAVPDVEARRLRALFDHVPALIAFWDKNMRNVIANEAYVEWFGVAPERMKGMHIREVLGERVFAMNLPYIERALAGEEQLFSRTLIDMHGIAHHTQAAYVPEIVAGEVRGFFVLVTDVTPWVEARRQMDEAQQLAELGSWSMAAGSREPSWSPQMYRITGLDPEVVTPHVDSLLPMVHADDRDRVAAAVARAMEAGEDYELDYRLVRPDGEVREVHSRVRAERTEDGVLTRLTGTLQDVTSSRHLNRELSRVNEELRQVNQLNSDVLGVVGHDVREPVTLLLGHLEELGATWEESPEELKLRRVEKALAATRRMAAMIDDVMAMAIGDSGTISSRPARVRVTEVVEDVLDDISGGDGVEVVGGRDLVAVVDPFHLRQMLTNLVVNALRYGGAPVCVNVTGEDGLVRIEVTDQGEGVPEEFVPHLFERFTRATSGVAVRTPGSGFGLYVLARLAEVNDCLVGYEPGAPHGACFTLRIPSGEGDGEGGPT